MSERQIKTTQKSGGKTQRQLNQPVWSDGEGVEKKKKSAAPVPPAARLAGPAPVRSCAAPSSLPNPLSQAERAREEGEEEEEEGEEEEEEEDGEQEQTCKHQSCEQKDCVASKTWDITLAQPESIRSDLESSDSQSDDVPDLTSDECASPRSHSAAPCPQTPSARGAESPSAPLSHCAHAEGCRLDEMVTLECIEARV